MLLATYAHPFTTHSRLKARARAERRHCGVRADLDWREDELWPLLKGVTTWRQAKVIVSLHQRGLV